MLSKEHLTLEGLKKYYLLERSLMSLFQRHEGWVRPLCMNKGGRRPPPAPFIPSSQGDEGHISPPPF